MNTIRRVYVYAIAFVGLMMVLAGAVNLVRLLLELVLRGPGALAGLAAYREQVAVPAALLIVGLPIWAVHWLLAQGSARQAGEQGVAERRALLRAFFLYGVLLVTAVVGLSNLGDGLAALLAWLLGERSAGASAAEVATPLAAALIAGLLWAGHWGIAAGDRQAVGEIAGTAIVRRCYVYGLGFVGFVLLLVFASGLLRTVWEAWASRAAQGFAGAGLAEQVGAEAARMLAGLAVWLWHAGWAGRLAAAPGAAGEAERGSLLRKIYLFAAVALAVGGTLVGASQGLRLLLMAALGDALPQGAPLALGLAEPVSMALVFGLAWAFAWREVEGEARRQAELPRQATVRRLYVYLVAFAGLAMLAVGVAGLLNTLFDRWLGPPSAGLDPGWWRDQISLYSTLVVVGAPVWLAHWADRQAIARASEEERRALPRRAYLYAVLLGGMLAILTSAAALVALAIRLALGQPADRQALADLAHLLVFTLVGAAALAYHWGRLRADGAARVAEAPATAEKKVPAAPEPAPSRPPGPAASALVVVTAADAAALAALLDALHQAAGGATVTAALTDEAWARAALEELVRAGRATLAPAPSPGSPG